MDFKDPPSPPAGDYSFGEYLDLVQDYRARWCRNELAVFPSPWNIKFLGDKKVVYLSDRVRLEETF
jgi:hypothetical protein